MLLANQLYTTLFQQQKLMGNVRCNRTSFGNAHMLRYWLSSRSFLQIRGFKLNDWSGFLVGGAIRLALLLIQSRGEYLPYVHVSPGPAQQNPEREKKNPHIINMIQMQAFTCQEMLSLLIMVYQERFVYSIGRSSGSFLMNNVTKVKELNSH